jgi:WD40 repeat protein
MLQGKQVLLLNQDGRPPVTIPAGEIPPGTFRGLGFGPDSKTVSVGFLDEVRLLSVPDGREVRHVKYEHLYHWGCPCRTAFNLEGNRRTYFRRPWDGGEQKLIGTLEFPTPVTAHNANRDFTAMAYALGRVLYMWSPARQDSPPRLLGEHPADVTGLSLSDSGQRLAAVDKSREIWIWDTASTSGRPLRVFEAPAVKGPPVGALYSAAERWVMSVTHAGGHDFIRLWDVTAPPGAGPAVLRSKASDLTLWDTDPLDRGFAAIDRDSKRLLFWPLPRSQPRVFEWPEVQITCIAFTPDGTTLVAANENGGLRAWPLSAEAAEPFRILPKAAATLWHRFAVAPTRREIARFSLNLHQLRSSKGAERRELLQVLSLDGGEPRELEGPPPGNFAVNLAFSPDGRRVAAAPVLGPAKEKRIRVWDLETGSIQVLEPVPKADDKVEGGFFHVSFVGEDRIVATVKDNGLMLFDLRDGKGKVLSPVINGALAIDRSGRFGVGTACKERESTCEILRFGLDGSAPVPLHRETGGAVALDPTGTLVASTGPEDSVQIGPISGGEPYLLFGHKGNVNELAFSPDGKWLASGGADQTVRLWPVPDVTKVPPHKRSHEEFVATLRTFTNLRAVSDTKAPNGWKLEPGPFPGWRTAPHW